MPKVNAPLLLLALLLGSFLPCFAQTPISVGQTVSGTLTPDDGRSVDCGGCFADLHEFSIGSSQDLVISLDSTDFDAFLAVLDTSGVVVATDDDGGGGLNSRISGTFAAGMYRIEATTHSPGEQGAYTLSLLASPVPTPTVMPISVGQTVSGTLIPGDRSSVGCGDCLADLYEFSIGSSQDLVITLDSTDFDAFLAVLDSSGGVVATDDDGGGGLNSRISRTFAAGTYQIEATTLSPGEQGVYTLSLQVPLGPPALPPNSVVNGASFRAATDPNGAIAPGALVAIFGTDLASDTLLAGEVPLPITLGDTSVTFNNITASLFFVSRVQINAQVPFELMTGSGTVSVQVRRGSETTLAQPIGIAAVSPGIFTLNQQGTGAGAILHADDFQPVNDSSPAQPGEFLAIFCTGLGPVQPEVASGDVAPTAEPLARTVTLPMVNIAGIAADVTFSGLAPGFVGLYQVNVQVPLGVPAGTQDVEVIINSVPSNTVTIAVQ